MLKKLLFTLLTAVGIGAILLIKLSFASAGLLSLVLFLYLFMALSFYEKFFTSNIEEKVEVKEASQAKLVPEASVSEALYQKLEQTCEVLTQKSEKLEKESKTTELFLASMSHEIRTPLNGIIGLTDLLNGTPLTEEQQEFISMIKESSDNLRVIVNDILDVSKINAGKMELELIEFDLFTKIEASVGVFVPKIEEKNINLNLFTDPHISQYVIGDPTRLSQVIINLISNAVKFTKNGGNIDVFAEFIESDHTEVSFKISVSDSGIGLTEEQQKRIFDAYSQADSSTTRKSGGTGLGLTISSKIIESMGGTLSVESQEGKGATFFFILTLNKSDKETMQNNLDVSSHSIATLLSDTHPKNQWHSILETYSHSYDIDYLACDEKMLFEAPKETLFFIDHRTIDADKLQKYASLPGKRILLTSSALHRELKREREIFDDIVYMPLSFSKFSKLVHQKEKSVEEVLPIEVETAPKIEVTNPVEKKIVPKKNIKGLQVLVAEDNPINQKLINVVLKNLGLNVTLVENGKEAVHARKSTQYDIIFMDIQMPVMGGVEATHEILAYEAEEKLAHIPIIALTANALTGDREKYMKEGMDNYATKPLDVKDIERLITQYCLMD